jgi:hypothetical protein
MLDVYKRQDLRAFLAGSLKDLAEAFKPDFWGNIWAEGILWVLLVGILVIMCTLGVLMTPLFLLARVYIVVEAFVSMRMVPAGAYANVQWAQWIPHI